MRLRSERDDAALVHEIVEAAGVIRRHLQALPGGTFHDNWLVRDTVCMLVVVIGEAPARLSAEFKVSLPEINWPGIVRTGHLLSHDYGAADPDILWIIATERVVELERALSAVSMARPD